MNPASTARTPIDVAVGVLIRADGKFLITSRPEGKPYAGYWEFPGGKLEVDETVEQALQQLCGVVDHPQCHARSQWLLNKESC